MTESYLQASVIHRCRELGTEQAAIYFDVSEALIRQWVAGSKTPSLAAVEKVFVVPDGPPAPAGWNDREVFLAMPFYRTTNPRTLWSILGVWDRDKFRASMHMGSAIVSITRNRLSTDFLSKTTCPWSWWLDDDMICPMGSASWFNHFATAALPEKFAGMHTPTRLRSHGKTMVSGLYVGRDEVMGSSSRGQYAEALSRSPAGDLENAFANSAPQDVIKPTDFAGFGCMMVHRQVFLDIQAKFPHLAPEKPGGDFHFFTNTSDAIVLALPELKAKVAAAETEVKGGTADAALKILADLQQHIESAERENTRALGLGHGEDKTFCRRAIASGHQVFVDHGLVCGHLGERVFLPKGAQR